MIDKSKLRAIFKKAQTNAKTAVEEGASRRARDERILDLKIGNSYRLRLLYYPTKTREKPFINLNIHRHYNPDTKEYLKVVCPTSEHIQGVQGFDTCPVCKALSDLWRRKQDGDQVAEKIYNDCRRTAENYAVVYVVKDSLTENSNAGKVKILRYGYQISDFLNMYCLGIPAKGQPAPDDEEVIGFEAFDLENGRDLIIKVGKKDVRASGRTIMFPSYETSFSAKTTSIPLTDDDLPGIFKELRFDEDFYKDVDTDALNNFYKKCILAEDSNDDKSSDEDEEDVPYEDEEPKFKKFLKKPAPKPVDDEDEDEDEDDEEEELPKNPVKKSKKIELPDDEEDDEEIETPKPKKKFSVKFDEEDDSDSDDDDDEEVEVAPKKKASSEKKKSSIEDDFDFEMPDDI